MQQVIKKTLLAAGLVAAMAGGQATAKDAAPMVEKTWKAGGWDVTFNGDQFEKHYRLEATGWPETPSPVLSMSCDDGHFTVNFPYEFQHKPYPYAVVLLSDTGKTLVFEAHPDNYGSVEFDGARAERMLTETKRLGVRFKMPGGKDKDFFYKLHNLAEGRQQLFNICPPPA